MRKTPPDAYMYSCCKMSKIFVSPLFLLALFACYSPPMSVNMFCGSGWRATKAKLTISRPFLLWRALPSQLRDLQTLQSILFLFIPRHEVEFRKLFLDVFDCGALAG